jgi:hypothetical protein
MTESQARQRVLAQMILETAFEARVRADPDGVAREHGAPVAYVRALAAIDPARVRAFRESLRHKDRVREGKPVTKLGW